MEDSVISPTEILYHEMKLQDMQTLSSLTVGIDLLDRCNLKCPHCMVEPTKEEEFSNQELEDIFGALAKVRIKSLGFSGGEVTLRDNLPMVIENANKKGLKLFIITNGVLLEQKWGNIAPYLAGIGTSIDGLQEWHDKYRGLRGSFEAALNVLNLARTSRIPSFVQFTLTPQNWDQLDEVLDICWRGGAVMLRISPVIRLGSARNINRRYLIPSDRYVEVLHRVIRLTGEYLGKINMQTSIVSKEQLVNHPCKAYVAAGAFCHANANPAPHEITIRADGRVMPLDGYLHSSFQLGNVKIQPLDKMLKQYFGSESHRRFLRLAKYAYFAHVLRNPLQAIPYCEYLAFESYKTNYLGIPEPELDRLITKYRGSQNC